MPNSETLWYPMSNNFNGKTEKRMPFFADTYTRGCDMHTNTWSKVPELNQRSSKLYGCSTGLNTKSVTREGTHIQSRNIRRSNRSPRSWSSSPSRTIKHGIHDFVKPDPNAESAHLIDSVSTYEKAKRFSGFCSTHCDIFLVTPTTNNVSLKTNVSHKLQKYQSL